MVQILHLHSTESGRQFYDHRSPSGEYYVAAVDWLQGTEGFGEWQDPAFLKSIAPRARRVTLADGQMAAVTLRLIIR